MDVKMGAFKITFTVNANNLIYLYLSITRPIPPPCPYKMYSTQVYHPQFSRTVIELLHVESICHRHIQLLDNKTFAFHLTHVHVNTHMFTVLHS